MPNADLSEHLQQFGHVYRGRVIETGMGLTLDLAETMVREVAEILGERDADAQSQGRGAYRARMALGLGEQKAANPMPSKVRMHGEAAEVKVPTVGGREHAPHEASIGFRHHDGVIGKGN